MPERICVRLPARRRRDRRNHRNGAGCGSSGLRGRGRRRARDGGRFRDDLEDGGGLQEMTVRVVYAVDKAVGGVVFLSFSARVGGRVALSAGVAGPPRLAPAPLQEWSGGRRRFGRRAAFDCVGKREDGLALPNRPTASRNGRCVRRCRSTLFFRERSGRRTGARLRRKMARRPNVQIQKFVQ